MKQYIKNIMILILALPWGLLLTNCSDSKSDYSDGLSCNSWGIKFSQFPSCIYLC